MIKFSCRGRKPKREVISIKGKNDYLDILWKSILMQYEEIIKTQKICFVDEKDIVIKEIKSEEESTRGSKTTYDIIYPWQKQAKLLEVQSKAVSSLKNLIDKYEALLHKSNLNGIDIEKQRTELKALKMQISENEHIFPEIGGEDDLSS